MHIFPSFVHPWSMLLEEVDLEVTLTVDSELVVTGVLSGVPAELDGSPVPPGGNFGTTQTVVFGIDGLGTLLATEDGFGTITRTFSLTVSSASPEEIIDWVWNTSEVPAGIAFNNEATPAIAVE
jgi:hypothetical protein